MTRRARAQRIRGAVPRLGRLFASVGRWVARHPHPFLFAGWLLLSCWGVCAFARRANVFRVAHVLLPTAPPLTLREPLIGENIWALDLQALAEGLRRQQPWLDEVRVIRQLPDAIRIEAIPRVPVAQVRLERWHAVDRSGFVLPEGRDEADERLIRVVGWDRAGTALKAGKANTDERLALALRALEALKREPAISRRITQLNVEDPREIRFLLDDTMEIRCGSESELTAHLARLRAALRAIAKHPVDIGYIDVRFQEPVVAPRTMQ